MSTRRVIFPRIITLIALLIMAIAPLHVAAHVALVAATPLPDSTIGQPPRRIVVRFDQEPEPGFDAITLLDTAGHSVAGGPATRVPDDPTAIAVTVDTLPPGIYTVAWQALAPDGHLTKGNYAFTLSTAPGPAAPASPEPLGASSTSATPSSVSVGTGNPSPAAVAIHWLRYVALGLVVGAFGLGTLVLSPALAAVGADEGQRRRVPRLLRGWALAGTILFLLAHGATLIAEAASDSGVAMAAVGGAAVRRVLLGTVYGGVWRVIAALALALLVGILVSLLPVARHRSPGPVLGIIATARPNATAMPPPAPILPTRWPWRLGLGTALLLTGALTFSSHAIESQHQPVLALLTDAAHLAAMGLWLGGLFVLLPTLPRLLRPLPDTLRTDVLNAVVGRFSTLGFVSVATLIATGVYTMTLHTTRATILGTSYGQTLLIKHALIVPLLAIAALNRLYVKPRLGTEERARRLLPWLLGGEAALGLGVLLLTATLTQLPPAHPLIGTDAAAANPALSGAKPVVLGATGSLAPDADVSSTANSTQTAQTDGFTMVLQTTTGRDGGALAVEALQGTGETGATQTQLAGVQEVYALVTFAGADLGQTKVPLARHADGWYRARGNLFPIAGQWQIEVVVRRQDVAEDARADFTFIAQPAGGQPGQTTPATPTETGFLWPRLLPSAYEGLLLALVGAGLAALTARPRFRASLPPRHLRAFRNWGIGALVAGIAVAGYFSADRTPTTDRANPLPNDAATLAIGQQVFAQNCALCHGPGGRGDGPMAASLNPRPVDLTAGHLTGHTDGDLYWWISHGIPGTGMPAWSGTLSEQEAWAVVRYLRSLRGGGP